MAAPVCLWRFLFLPLSLPFLALPYALKHPSTRQKRNSVNLEYIDTILDLQYIYNIRKLFYIYTYMYVSTITLCVYWGVIDMQYCIRYRYMLTSLLLPFWPFSKCQVYFDGLVITGHMMFPVLFLINIILCRHFHTSKQTTCSMV